MIFFSSLQLSVRKHRRFIPLKLTFPLVSCPNSRIAGCDRRIFGGSTLSEARNGRGYPLKCVEMLSFLLCLSLAAGASDPDTMDGGVPLWSARLMFLPGYRDTFVGGDMFTTVVVLPNLTLLAVYAKGIYEVAAETSPGDMKLVAAIPPIVLEQVDMEEPFQLRSDWDGNLYLGQSGIIYRLSGPGNTPPLALHAQFRDFAFAPNGSLFVLFHNGTMSSGNTSLFVGGDITSFAFRGRGGNVSLLLAEIIEFGDYAIYEVSRADKKLLFLKPWDMWNVGVTYLEGWVEKRVFLGQWREPLVTELTQENIIPLGPYDSFLERVASEDYESHVGILLDGRVESFNYDAQEASADIVVQNSPRSMVVLFPKKFLSSVRAIGTEVNGRPADFYATTAGSTVYVWLNVGHPIRRVWMRFARALPLGWAKRGSFARYEWIQDSLVQNWTLWRDIESVSYTHLTLPTKRIV